VRPRLCIHSSQSWRLNHFLAICFRGEDESKVEGPEQITLEPCRLLGLLCPSHERLEVEVDHAGFAVLVMGPKLAWLQVLVADEF
jgi:hypothetical protein